MRHTSQSRTRREARTVKKALGATVALLGVSVSGFAASAVASTRHETKPVVISTVKNKQLGTLLVSGGRTLYTLKASTTACSSACTKIWPEVLLPKGVTKATAGPGVSAAKLGTVKRAGGALQVTYAGKALYRFSGDKSPGQVHGNFTDAWGKWSDVVTAKPARSHSSSGASSNSAAGTGGIAF